MKNPEEKKELPKEATQEQEQKASEERQFWLDTKYPNESGDSNR